MIPAEFQNAILQIKTSSSGPSRQVINSTSPIPITGLSVSLKPYKSDSLIIIRSQIITNAVHVSSFGVYKDGQPTVDTSGYTNTNQPNMQITTYIGSSTNNELWNKHLIWSEESGSVESRVYQIYATAGWSGSTYSLQINNRNSNDMASFSHIVVMEIEK